MTIRNKAEMASEIDAKLPTGGLGIVAVDHRSLLTDMVDSTSSTFGGIGGGSTPALEVTATPTKIADFSADTTPANDLFTPDAANDRIIVKDPCAVFVNFRLAGMWPAVEDLTVEIYLNGVPNPMGPISLTQEGAGAADVQNVAISGRGFVINQAAIDESIYSNAGEAIIEMFWSSDTGTFDVDQLEVALNLQYINYSIRAVG